MWKHFVSFECCVFFHFFFENYLILAFCQMNTFLVFFLLISFSYDQNIRELKERKKVEQKNIIEVEPKRRKIHDAFRECKNDCNFLQQQRDATPSSSTDRYRRHKFRNFCVFWKRKYLRLLKILLFCTSMKWRGSKRKSIGKIIPKNQIETINWFGRQTKRKNPSVSI